MLKYVSIDEFETDPGLLSSTVFLLFHVLQGEFENFILLIKTETRLGSIPRLIFDNVLASVCFERGIRN